MLVTNREVKRATAGFLLILLATELSYVIFWGNPRFRGLTAFLYCGLILYWGVSVSHRILHRRIRRYLVSAAGLMLLLFIFRIFRYELISGHPVLDPLAWWGYYISFTGVPLLLFMAVQGLGVPEYERPERRFRFLWWIWLALCALFMTNSLHGLLIRAAITESGERTSYGPLFLIQLVWAAVLELSAFLVMMRKCRRSASRRLALVPLIFAAAGVFLLIWYFISGGSPAIAGNRVFNLHEAYCFPIIVLCESCIRIGLLPSNSGYEDVFRLAHLNAAVTDRSGRLVLSSEDHGTGAATEHQRVMEQEIPGGQITWTEDLSNVDRLRLELEELAGQADEENLLAEEELRINEEIARYEARNLLYDRISAVVRPQVEVIEQGLQIVERPGDPAESASDGTGLSDAALRSFLLKNTVRAAYIKRRANLALLADVSSGMDAAELFFALRESFEYLNLSGITCAVNASGSGQIPSSLAILCYELFGTMLERSAASMHACYAEVAFSEGTFSMLLETDGEIELREEDLRQEEFRREGAAVSRRCEDETFYLTVRREGGAS